jgi:hypothetical protein
MHGKGEIFTLQSLSNSLIWYILYSSFLWYEMVITFQSMQAKPILVNLYVQIKENYKKL